MGQRMPSMQGGGRCGVRKRGGGVLNWVHRCLDLSSGGLSGCGLGDNTSKAGEGSRTEQGENFNFNIVAVEDSATAWGAGMSLQGHLSPLYIPVVISR